jgi:hypothetical protein
MNGVSCGTYLTAACLVLCATQSDATARADGVMSVQRQPVVPGSHDTSFISEADNDKPQNESLAQEHYRNDVRPPVATSHVTHQQGYPARNKSLEIPIRCNIPTQMAKCHDLDNNWSGHTVPK